MKEKEKTFGVLILAHRSISQVVKEANERWFDLKVSPTKLKKKKKEKWGFLQAEFFGVVKIPICKQTRKNQHPDFVLPFLHSLRIFGAPTPQNGGTEVHQKTDSNPY